MLQSFRDSYRILFLNIKAHSLSSRGKLRGKGFISSSPSTHSVKSWNGPQTNSGSQPLTKSEALNNRRNLAASFSSSSFKSNQQLNHPTIRPSMSLNDVPLSPNSIDERLVKRIIINFSTTYTRQI